MAWRGDGTPHQRFATASLQDRAAITQGWVKVGFLSPTFKHGQLLVSREFYSFLFAGGSSLKFLVLNGET